MAKSFLSIAKEVYVPGEGSKAIAEESLNSYEACLAAANFRWSKRITLYDFAVADKKMFKGNSRTVELKFDSGIWIDYENQRIAVRNTAATTLGGGLKNKWSTALGKKADETPDIISFSDIQDCKISEGTSSGASGGMSLRIIASGAYGARSLQVELLQQGKAFGESGFGKMLNKVGYMQAEDLTLDHSEYQGCLDCLYAMSNEIKNIIQTMLPPVAPVAIAQQPAQTISPPQNKFCTACGTKLAMGVAFCNGCGAKQ